MKGISFWIGCIAIGLSLFSACTVQNTAIEKGEQPFAVPVTSTPLEITPTLENPTVIPPVEEVTIEGTVFETPSVVALCSPIEGLNRQDLEDAVVTPFLPPPPGSDDPHHGVDLAEFASDSDIALEGRGVNAMMSGRVAGIILDRFPYGNGVIIETPLRDIATGWVDLLHLPEIEPVELNASPLTCPSMEESLVGSVNTSGRSLYFLYAHLKNPPAVKTGDFVICGQPIGLIGNTGNSINPHLHLEVRVGTENIKFESMAHYDDSATIEEMKTYCLWRISGYFQYFDPMMLIDYVKD